MWAWQTWAKNPFLSPAVLSVWFKQAQLEHTDPQSQARGQSTHLVEKGLWKLSAPGSSWPPGACNPGIFESVQKPTTPTVGLIFRVGLLKTLLASGAAWWSLEAGPTLLYGLMLSGSARSLVCFSGRATASPLKIPVTASPLMSSARDFRSEVVHPYVSQVF